ncbi:gamma-glutamyltransferase [Brackiella oedipodis]|uniref:gamma-glutamyltransferase n=1 Tax=Brackiella oedipodis TaxID=124225 RepID=UPI00048CFB2A|nr:gamma-glutamyltransferase [Brackiella oedipodis]
MNQPSLHPKISQWRLILTATICGLSLACSPVALAQSTTAPNQAGTAAISTQPSPKPNYDYDLNVFHPVIAQNGMVASEQALASKIGLQILQKGGNAVDAAVAVGFALAVALPNAGNIGGGGFMLVHDAQSHKNIALDFRETAPAAATETMYQDQNGNIIPGKSWFTHTAVGVPGTVKGLEHALKKWGTMKLADVMQPAIELAEKGFRVSATLADALANSTDHLGKWDNTKAIFYKNGEPLKMGDKLVMTQLAKSLKLIAKNGSDAFYKGPIAKAIVDEMAKHEGLITQEDLANYKVVERQPVSAEYRGYQVVTMPPPSSGGIHIIQMLNVLSHFPLSDYGPNSAKTIRLMAETMKYAYADRSEYLGDPDFIKIPQKQLTSTAYADHLAKIVGKDEVVPAKQIKAGDLAPYESDQTTHYSVVDKQGNAVAVTYTLNLNFGSGIVAGDTGILLNNEMDDFSAKPGEPNAFGLIGGKANAIEGHKRPLSSMTPTIVLKDNKTWMVTGSPGGARIITTVLQTLVNGIDFKMNPAANAATPRFHHQWTPDELRLEQGFSPDTVSLLQKMGYKTVVKPSMGRTQTIQVGNGYIYGYSDPRNPDGSTLGY